jgi:putative oxidoreductase
MRLRHWFLHPWLTVRAQFTLGLVFFLAALAKIADPPGFAKSIWLYQLAPAWSIHPAALVLPWLELLCGVALCLGLWARAAAAWLAALLLIFIAALSINLARHNPVDCGCFGTASAARTQAERLADMQWTILRDLGLLLLAAQVLASGRTGRRPE